MQTFEMSDYVKQTYLPDLAPINLREDMEKEGVNIPYAGLEFAQEAAGEMQSFLKKDQGLRFEDSCAHRILADEKCDVRRESVLHEADGELSTVTRYSLLLENKSSSIFQPTVTEPISDACNVTNEVTMELLFAFGDGYVCPVTTRYKVRNIDMGDLLRDIADDLEIADNEEDILEALQDSPNIKKGDGFLRFICSSAQTGRIEDVNLETDSRDSVKDAAHTLKQSLVSARIIGINTIIDGKKKED